MVFQTAYYLFSPDYTCEIDIWAKAYYVLINAFLLVYAFTSAKNIIIEVFRSWQIIVTIYNLLIIFLNSAAFWGVCNNRIVCLFLCLTVAFIFIKKWISKIKR